MGMSRELGLGEQCVLRDEVLRDRRRLDSAYRSGLRWAGAGDP